MQYKIMCLLWFFINQHTITNMKKQIVGLVLGVVFSNLMIAQQNPSQLSPEFDKVMQAQFKPKETGASVLVAKKGQVIYKKAFGTANLELSVPMQVDNVFRIGSITKQFTAIAILQLMEQGKLSLQDPITKYIPDYPTQGATITLEHLLTHTSGIRDYASIRDTTRRGSVDYSPTEMIDYFKNQPMRFAPGTRWEYSNSGYFLLGYIIEKITGKPYRQYLDENFFTPLGMSNSAFASDVKIVKNRADGYSKSARGVENAAYLSMTHPYAAGAIQSTVEDLFKWHQAVMSYKLVKKETLDKAFTRYKLLDGKETSYGYGWRLGYIQGSPSIWHGGLINGFIAMQMYLPKEDVFVAVFSNCDCNSPVDVTAKLAALAIGQPYETKAMPVTEAALQAYTGVFENEKGVTKAFTVSGNQLYIQTGRGPTSPITAYQKDKFFFNDDAMVTLEFVRNNKGEIEKMITRSRTLIETFNKTNKPLPNPDGIKLDEKILDRYLGVYELTPDFTMTVTREGDRMFIQATKQEKLEMFAEAENKFFLKIVDAQMEFVSDASGKVTKILVYQNGRQTEAKKVK